MKKKMKTKSLTAKSIIIILLCSAIFITIALPVVQNATLGVFHPYLVEYTTQRMSDSAILMSTFLADANTAFKIGFSRFSYFSDSEDTQNSITQAEQDEAIAKFIEPLEVSFPINNEEVFSCISYPAIYIEGRGIFCDPSIEDEISSIIESEWFQYYKNEQFGERLYPLTIYQEESDLQPEYFGYIISSMKGSDPQTPLYSILLSKYSDILPLWNSIFELDINDFAFYNKNFDLLYQQGDLSELDLSWIQNDPATNLQHRIIIHEENDEIYCSVLVSYKEEGLRFVMRVPNDIFSNLFSDVSLLIQTTFIILVAVFIVIVFIILRQIFKRLTALSEKMAVVQNGNYDVTLDDSSGDEIGQLASAFNVMTSTIQDNINKLVEKEQREKMLQYNLMVSAIDPHFVYNTLNTSTRLAELGRNDEVVIVNDALINCLKDNLKMKNYQSFDTVASEIDTIEQYITIQNYLCDNTITLKHSISNENMQLEIPKFLLQPLVENSILHGILMNIDSKGNMIAGMIEIDAEQIKDRIRIKIKDNGVGMSQETIEQYFYTDENIILNENAHIEHIGVLNMRTRLSHLYHDNYSVTVKSELGKGTEIIIEIPANQ